MSKYPCGACTTGVKHKGILCTGECHKWYHSKCLNWTDKKLKNLTKLEIENWKCERCIAEPDESNVTRNLEEVKDKIQNMSNIGEDNLETSLSLAAEVGNALLAENHQLKQNIAELTTSNSKLKLEIEELKNSKISHTTYQYQIEELEVQKETILSKYSMLVEKLNHIEKQLIKEKRSRNDLEKMFDDADKEKEEIISKHENTIKALQKKADLEHSNPNSNLNQDKKKKTAGNAATQTDEDSSPSVRSHGSSALSELMEIKTKQACMEDAVRLIQKQLTLLTCSKLSTINSETQTQHANPPTQTKTSNHIKKILNLNVSKKINSPSRGNSFSVSLQRAKYRADCEIETDKNTLKTPQKFIKPTQKPNSQSINPHSGKFKVTSGPPITATKLNPSETIEEFYCSNIDKLTPHYTNTDNGNTSNSRESSPTQTHFLDSRQEPNLNP